MLCPGVVHQQLGHDPDDHSTLAGDARWLCFDLFSMNTGLRGQAETRTSRA